MSKMIHNIIEVGHIIGALFILAFCFVPYLLWKMTPFLVQQAVKVRRERR